MSTLKDLRLKMIKSLIPKTLPDLLHMSICLNIFFAVWDIANKFSENGIWFAFGATILIAYLKELNDQHGFIPWLLTDGKTKTGFSGRDFWIGVEVPFFIMVFYYIFILK